MTLLELFTSLLEKQQEQKLPALLKDLTSAQKKELVPHIKTLSKEYFEYRPAIILSLNSYTRKASPVQEKILRIAAFVCFNYTDYKKHDTFGYILNNRMLEDILEWYCPDWLSSYINGYRQANFMHYQLTYQRLMELADKGFIVPQKELLVKVLPQSIYERSDNKNDWQYKPEHLLASEVTLKEHIWYLFELESNINWSNRYMRFDQELVSDQTSWIFTLISLSDEGKIDRQRLLKESLLATCKNFNKTLSGWFAQLFTALAPDKEELIGLQVELFATFNSPHSKPITTSLQYCKILAQQARFDSQRFLDYVPLLLSSKTKTILSATLSILEKLAKKHPGSREQICLVSSQVFIHREEDLQTKAAAIIEKYGDSSYTELQVALLPYYDSMLSTPRTILKHFLHQNVAEPDSPLSLPESFQPIVQISEENQIKPIETIDELIYLVSQAFDNNESFHVDVLPAALINLQNEIKGDAIAKLASAFQRAYKIVLEGWQSTSGHLDHLLATFFIDYGRWLVKKYPHETKSIQELHSKYTAKDEGYLKQWSFYNLRIGKLHDWKTYNNDTMYEPYKQLLLAALAKIITGSTLPLLSTPTHTPGWIAPVALIKRLSQYQNKGVVPEPIDFQIALSRCAFENMEEALQEATSKLSGEYRELIKFLLVRESRPHGPLTQQVLWMVAALTKSPLKTHEEFAHFTCTELSRNFLSGQHSWKTYVEAYTYDRYDYVNRKTVLVHDTRKLLEIDSKATGKRQIGLSTILKFFTAKSEDEKLFYEHLKIKDQYLSVEHNDIKRLLLLIPHNPEPILAQIANKCLKYPSYGEAGDTKLLINTLECLLGIWKEFGEMAHLFVAACMLNSDKTVRSYAAAIWVEGIHKNSINSELVGEILGKHESIEFAPLKRLIDLINSNMMGISGKHTKALENMITALLTQLLDTPIHNHKKLLQLYLEILSLNKSIIRNTTIIHQLSVWKSTASLQTVITTLEKKVIGKEEYLLLTA
ncbi:DUF6493 family protein [Rhodocytophaga aerolata]|uniref:DUF6493 family protein n=1 Tax=Rhodocytophaga aerolata TaxID=455078 RepID=A0ABT8RG11_9BACT|nr:DUF6493 family protein [Rhodocytophaga aerolata]MDO1449652.1 DUF6493 family protein [Rhodocytophaga aerolata]